MCQWWAETSLLYAEQQSEREDERYLHTSSHSRRGGIMGKRASAHKKDLKRNRRHERTNHPHVCNHKPGRKQKPKESHGPVSHGYFGIIERYFGRLKYFLKNVADPRKDWMTTYPPEVLLWQALFMFQTHIESRRQFERDKATDAFRANLGIISGNRLEHIAHIDTVNYFMANLNPEELQKVIRKNIRDLIRSKVLDDFRFDGNFLVAVDGVCFATFKHPHCEYCLRRTTDGVTTYFHYALVAMLVSPTGLVLPIEIEFIENTPDKGKTLSEKDDEFKKQDCELKAFYRLVGRLKEKFPRLPVTLLLDGLYANRNVISICDKNNWNYFISLQKDSLPAFQKAVASNLKKHQENTWQHRTEDCCRTFRWTTVLRHDFQKDSQKKCSPQPLLMFVIEETEDFFKTKTKRKFAYITNHRPSRENIMELIHEGARQRWKIENETFNTLKNHGMELQHSYGNKGYCLQNYFLVRFIALSIEQFLTFSNGLIKILSPNTILPSREKGISLFGSLKQMAKRLLESLRNDIIEIIDLSNVRFSIFSG